MKKAFNIFLSSLTFMAIGVIVRAIQLKQNLEFKLKSRFPILTWDSITFIIDLTLINPTGIKISLDFPKVKFVIKQEDTDKQVEIGNILSIGKEKIEITPYRNTTVKNIQIKVPLRNLPLLGMSLYQLSQGEPTRFPIVAHIQTNIFPEGTSIGIPVTREEKVEIPTQKK